MSYTDLITFSDVEQGAIGSLDVTELGGEVESLITSVTRRIEAHLDRTLIVQRHVQLGRHIGLAFDHDVSTDTTDNFSFWTDEWPVLEVGSVTPSGYTLQVHPDGRRLYTDLDTQNDALRQVGYFAGYKRPDQTLSSLQGEPGLSDLTTEPDDLPTDIKRVAVSLVLYELIRHQDGTLGQRTTSTSGPVSITVDGADPNFPARELRTLDTYRSLT